MSRSSSRPTIFLTSRNSMVASFPFTALGTFSPLFFHSFSGISLCDSLEVIGIKKLPTSRTMTDHDCRTNLRTRQIRERNRQKDDIISRAIHDRHHAPRCLTSSSDFAPRLVAKLGFHPAMGELIRQTSPDNKVVPDSWNDGEAWHAV